ncbi:MAG: glycosyltransferase family 2 protein [Flavobacteriales bacterium]
MKVTGFSFIKNAIVFEYPIVEAIKSILPICDEFVVAVGKSDDETRQLITSIDPEKIKIIDTVWDESLRKGGEVLAKETDKAFAAISKDSDWAFYIQGDEVVHEKYLKNIRESMLKYKDHDKIDGLLFNYLHFYASYDYVGASFDWYDHEIRIIKNDKSIFSFKDAQGFRKEEGRKLRVAKIDAFIYHYGWVREPSAMQRKQESFHKMWHGDEWIEKNLGTNEEFNYEHNLKELKRFEGTHPSVMQKRIDEKNWKFDIDISRNYKTKKDKLKGLMKNKFGMGFYKNYTIEK